MRPSIARWWLLLLVFAVLPVLAQTRAWLDRAEITMGETVALNIATDQSIAQIDYGPLRAQFELGGQSVRRSYEWVNGRSQRTSVFSVGLRPRAPGLLVVPALQVGKARTASLRLVVLQPTVQPASSDVDVFIETDVDAMHPYVQQAVGVTVRLNYAIPLLSGQLELDAPANANLQRVGEDITYQRLLGGRRYNVVERRFLLIPERSGSLLLPGARVNGVAGSGFGGGFFADDRRPVSAAAPAKQLQVLPIPANAPTPWLPLRALSLRYLQAPTQAWTGMAVTVEVEAVADGASAAQMPTLRLPEVVGVQQYAEPVQLEEQFINGRPRTTARRKFALVPTQPGTLTVPASTLVWWDAQGQAARTAGLPALQIEVVAGRQAAPAVRAKRAAAEMPVPQAGVVVPAPPPSWVRAAWPWLVVLALVVLALGLWQRHRRVPPRAVATAAVSLSAALRAGEPAAIIAALAHEAGLAGADLDAVGALLDDPAQVQALHQLQAARWGGGDVEAALQALRMAFAGGPHWRLETVRERTLLPPLYPK